MRKITIGSDAEIFLIDSENKHVCVLDKLGGTKESPLDFGDGIYVQEDNVAAEFNIPPVDNKKDFVKYIQLGIDKIASHMKAYGLTLDFTPAVNFDWDQLKDQRAQVFGCEPDFNAWTQDINIMEVDGVTTQLRSIGGHIHIGGIGDSQEATFVKRIICVMDLFTCIPMLLVEPDTDRRKLYGKAGSFRFKPYGLEYRSLSSYWLSSPELMGYIYDQTMEALAINEELADIIISDERIREAINTSDKELALELINEYSIKVPNVVLQKEPNSEVF